MHSRRAILLAAGAGATALAAGCGGQDEQRREKQARTAADLEILRFLLRLEQVTTAYWEEVVSRDALKGDPAAARTAADIARNERTHQETLDALLRRRGRDETAPAPPSTKFDDIFAAGPKEVLRSGSALANLAASAYLGQANRVQDRNLLASVLAIQSVEGRQAAALGMRSGGEARAAVPAGAFAEPLSMDRVRSQLKRYTG